MLLIGELLLDNAENYPDRFAVITKERCLTYRELNRESNCVANALKKLGLKRGDCLAFLMKNSIEWVIAWYACQKLGVVCMPLHARLLPEELARCIKIAGCKAIIYQEGFSDSICAIENRFCRLETKICVGSEINTDKDSNIIKWMDLYNNADYSEAQENLENDSPAVLLFTSGTTGNPKGVLRTQEMITLHGITLAIRNCSPHLCDILLSTAPLYHIGGLQTLLKMLVLGGTYATYNTIEPDEILGMIDRHKVTQLQMLPPITYERLYRSYKTGNYDLSSVWEVCISAGKCTLEYTDHIFEMFPVCHLRPSWGSTETCSVTCMQLTREDLQEHPEMINSIGTIMPFTMVHVVNDDGTEVMPGESGEALVKSPMVFNGYMHDMDCGCPSCFTEDGWFKTGDIVRVDPNTGCFYFQDRIKDIIKTGGETIYALEVERMVEKYPAVYECAAIGIPDERFGEAVGIAVVPNKGYSINAKDLVQFCNSHMARFKKPRYLAIMDRLPENSTGKIAKNVLREKYICDFRPIEL